MATIKDIKKELDKRGIEYPKTGLKAEYEILLAIPSEVIAAAGSMLLNTEVDQLQKDGKIDCDMSSPTFSHIELSAPIVKTNKEHFKSLPACSCEFVHTVCDKAFDILVENGVIDPEADFIDPNADPCSQAE